MIEELVLLSLLLSLYDHHDYDRDCQGCGGVEVCEFVGYAPPMPPRTPSSILVSMLVHDENIWWIHLPPRRRQCHYHYHLLRRYGCVFVVHDCCCRPFRLRLLLLLLLLPLLDYYYPLSRRRCRRGTHLLFSNIYLYHSMLMYICE